MGKWERKRNEKGKDAVYSDTKGKAGARLMSRELGRMSKGRSWEENSGRRSGMEGGERGGEIGRTVRRRKGERTKPKLWKGGNGRRERRMKEKRERERFS